jgi:hypothetical protein
MGVSALQVDADAAGTSIVMPVTIAGIAKIARSDSVEKEVRNFKVNLQF